MDQKTHSCCLSRSVDLHLGALDTGDPRRHAAKVGATRSHRSIGVELDAGFAANEADRLTGSNLETFRRGVTLESSEVESLDERADDDRSRGVAIEKGNQNATCSFSEMTDARNLVSR